METTECLVGCSEYHGFSLGRLARLKEIAKDL